jgi:hypothetical protein
MTLNDGFERTVSTWLDERAGHGAPDYLDEILTRTIRTRQRPWWSSPERWLPVQTTLRFTPVPRIALVLLVLVALVAALAFAAIEVGSRHRQPAPPFGLARNGAILYSGTDGDIHTLDPVTGDDRAVVTGATTDQSAVVSPDGTKVLFLRVVTDSAGDPVEKSIMVANVDGTDIRPLTGPLKRMVSLLPQGITAVWSHDGSKVAVASSVASQRALQVFTVDGSTDPVDIDIKGMTPTFVAFRPEDRELTFRGSTSTADVPVDADGLYAVGADGRGLRTIVSQTIGDGAALSPDGSRLAYQTWDGTSGNIHVVDVETGRDTTPTFEPDASSTGPIDDAPQWSPDGSRFLFIRYLRGPDNHLAVAPATGGLPVEIGPAMPNNASPWQAQFSPDGTRILVHYEADGSTWLLDPTGSTPGTLLPSSIAGVASWQRLAP